MKKGFTLIEVLIVVIILGILATLALPQFSKMTKRALLAEAWSGLGGIRTAQALYYMDKNFYATTLSNLDFTAPSGGVFAYDVLSTSTSLFTGRAVGNTANKSIGITAWIWKEGNDSYVAS